MRVFKDKVNSTGLWEVTSRRMVESEGAGGSSFLHFIRWRYTTDICWETTLHIGTAEGTSNITWRIFCCYTSWDLRLTWGVCWGVGRGGGVRGGRIMQLHQMVESKERHYVQKIIVNAKITDFLPAKNYKLLSQLKWNSIRDCDLILE